MAITSSGERLTDIILSNRMSKKDFAKALGYNPSYITQICLNIKQPSQEFAAKVEKFFGVSAQWLIHGEQDAEPAYTSPLKEAVLAKVSRITSDEALQALLAFINCYEELPKIHALKNKAAAKIQMSQAPKLYRVPIKGTVSGGAPIVAYQSDDEIVQTPIFADSALYLKGKSMEPAYPDGALLLVKENAYISNGDVVIALIMKEAEIAEATCKVFKKRRGNITLTPLNSEFPVQEYFESDGWEIKVYGKVIGIADDSAPIGTLPQ